MYFTGYSAALDDDYSGTVAELGDLERETMEWIIENSHQNLLQFRESDAANSANTGADPCGQIKEEMEDDESERFLLELGIATNEDGQKKQQVIILYLYLCHIKS